MTPAERIARLLDKNTAAGLYPHQVFEDWLDLVHASLTMMPDHLRSGAATGRPVIDPPDTQSLLPLCARPTRRTGIAQLHPGLWHPSPER